MTTVLRSFDVFDTVLTRRVGAPEAVLPLAAAEAVRRGVPAAVPVDALVAARRRAEPALERLRGRPATLVEIAAEVARRLALPDGAVPLLVEAEEAVERDLSVVVPGALELLADARRQASSGSVVFVSDTPHRTVLVDELLTRAGAKLPGDRLYCSADCGATKAHGRLYDLVARDLGADPATVLHVGDDLRSDVGSAAAQGWRSALRSRGRLDRYEHLWEREHVATGGLSSLLAGASRTARLRGARAGVATGVADVAAGVVAPLLIGFALWVAAEAERSGLRRLYFVSRDGEVMLEAARPVLDRLLPDVECRYLYGSRQAWQFAGLAAAPETLAGWVDVQKGTTARAVLVRVGHVAEEVHDPRAPGCLSPGRVDAPLTARDRDELRAWLQRPDVVERVRTRAGTAARDARTYLVQEGFGEAVPSALVDLGWRGHTARAFDLLLASGGLPPVRHLFLGLTAEAASVRSGSSGTDLAAWLFDLSRGTGAPHGGPAGLVTALESFCAGREGRCTGYRRAGDVVVPVLSSPQNTPVLDWGLEGLRAVVADVVEQVAPHLEAAHTHLDLATPAAAAASLFWTSPSAQEVADWGSYPYEDETWPPFNPLAERISTPDVLRRLVRGDANIRRVQSWRAGTAAVSPQPWRGLLRATAWRERHGVDPSRIGRRLRLELATRRGGAAGGPGV